MEKTNVEIKKGGVDGTGGGVGGVRADVSKSDDVYSAFLSRSQIEQLEDAKVPPLRLLPRHVDDGETGKEETEKEKEIQKERDEDDKAEEAWLGHGRLGKRIAEQLDRDGYVVLRGFVESELCDKITQEAFERMNKLFGLKREDRSTWRCIPRHGCVDIWHLPSLYSLRQHPQLYSIFAQILKTPNLCVSIDRVCMKPSRNSASSSTAPSEPSTSSSSSSSSSASSSNVVNTSEASSASGETGDKHVVGKDGGVDVEFEFDISSKGQDSSSDPYSSSKGSEDANHDEISQTEDSTEGGPWPLPNLHSDWNFWHMSEDEPEFQGGICLDDCPIGGGGFFCLPGFHKKAQIARYKAEFEAGKFGNDPTPPQKAKVFVDFLDHQLVQAHAIEIPMKKGDVVIWNSCLPHAGGTNHLRDFWRLQAFVRFLALDGPCATPEMKVRNRRYRSMVAFSMQTGEKPTHFSTGNAVRGPAKARKLEVPLHEVPEMSKIGRRLWGLETDEEESEEEEEGEGGEDKGSEE